MGYPFESVQDVLNSYRTGKPHAQLKSSAGTLHKEDTEKDDPNREAYKYYYNESVKCITKAKNYLYSNFSTQIIDALVFNKNSQLDDRLEPVYQVARLFGATETQVKRIRKDFYKNLRHEAERMRLIPRKKRKK